MKIKTNKAKIFIYWVSALFVVMAILSIVLHCYFFKNIISAIVNSVIISIVCAIFFVIFFFIGKNTSNTNDKHKYKGEVLRPDDEFLTTREKIKKFFISFAILAGCGIGYIPLFIFGSINVNKMHSDAFVKTTATIEAVVSEDTNVSSLVYAYFDEEGLRYFGRGGASWGGATFKEGKEVTVYYSKDNPEIMLTPSNTVMTFFGASFFLIMGIFAFSAYLDVGINKSGLIGVFFGLLFLSFPVCIITGIKLASGLSLIELFASGAMVYAMICFGVVGLLLIGLGLTQAVADVKATINYKKHHKYSLDKEAKAALIAEKAEAQKLERIKKKEEKKNNKHKYKYYFSFHSSDIPLLLAGLVFFGVGVWVFIQFSIIPIFKSFKYENTQATVISVETFESKDSGNLIASFTYEYYVSGERYEKESSYSQSAELAPSVGDTIKIKYNPDDPTDVLDSAFENWIIFAVGLLVSGVGLSLLIWTFFQCRYKKIVIEDPNKKIEEPKNMGNKQTQTPKAVRVKYANEIKKNRKKRRR